MDAADQQPDDVDGIGVINASPSSRDTIGSHRGMQSADCKPKRVKGPGEDAWLLTHHDPDIDRNFLHSIRRVDLNPDLPKMRRFRCYCGNEVEPSDSWYLLVWDGTPVCNACACCHCCGRQSVPNSRKLVCVDGLALCYACLRFYGYRRRIRTRARLVANTRKDMLSPSAATEETTEGGAAPVVDGEGGGEPPLVSRSNSEYYDYNVPRENRHKFRPKKDARRRIRARYYDSPARRLAAEDDPCDVPPLYLAENSRPRPMQCPACNSHALGPNAYTVPAMGQVYHRRCFRCCNCKETLAYGVKLPGIAFLYCGCEAPLVWCTKRACRAARLLHHGSAKCRLGSLHPGGRPQMDYTVEPSASATRSGRRRKRKPGSASDAKDTAHHPPANHNQLSSNSRLPAAVTGCA